MSRSSREIGSELSSLRVRISAVKMEKEKALKPHTQNIESLERRAGWLDEGDELNSLMIRITEAKKKKEDVLRRYTQEIDRLESEAIWLKIEYKRALGLEEASRKQKKLEGQNFHIVSVMLQELAKQ